MVFKASEALCLWWDLLIKGVQCKWNNLVKERNFFYYLGRIKQNNKKQMLSKVGGGGGCNPPQPLPWIYLCDGSVLMYPVPSISQNWKTGRNIWQTVKRIETRQESKTGRVKEQVFSKHCYFNIEDDWLLILPSSCYTFPCKLVTRILCQIKITFTY